MCSKLIDDSPAISLVFAAGFATSPDFMKMAAERFAGLFHAVGSRVTAHHLFPYGDWGTSRLRQLNEIRRDLTDGSFLRPRSVGGDRLAEVLREIVDRELGGQALLVGHSAGGVACIQAVRRLFETGKGIRMNIKIVMIGSPKCPIPIPAINPADVLYLYGVNRRGRRSDPITRLGRWGKTPPGFIEGVSIIGGHADYFRSRPPFVDEQGRTNLDRIQGLVWDWLMRRKEDQLTESTFSSGSAGLTPGSPGSAGLTSGSSGSAGLTSGSCGSAGLTDE